MGDAFLYGKIGVDISGITATPDDVSERVTFIDKGGELAGGDLRDLRDTSQHAGREAIALAGVSYDHNAGVAELCVDDGTNFIVNNFTKLEIGKLHLQWLGDIQPEHILNGYPIFGVDGKIGDELGGELRASCYGQNVNDLICEPVNINSELSAVAVNGDSNVVVSKASIVSEIDLSPSQIVDGQEVLGVLGSGGKAYCKRDSVYASDSVQLTDIFGNTNYYPCVSFYNNNAMPFTPSLIVMFYNFSDGDEVVYTIYDGATQNVRFSRGSWLYPSSSYKDTKDFKANNGSKSPQVIYGGFTLPIVDDTNCSFIAFK